MVQFLIQFAQQHVDFELAELDSVLKLCGVDAPRTLYDATEHDAHSTHPFLEITLPSVEIAKAVSERAVLIKRIYELWATAEDGKLETLVSKVREVAAAKETNGFARLCDATLSWSLKVSGFGRKIALADQEAIRATFTFVPLNGPVSIRGADNTFWVVTDFVRDPKLSGAEVPVPRKRFYAREVGTGPRHLLKEHSLKKRRFLGPTTMDAELSLVMANMGLVRPGLVAFDPYVGTGSLLVACAQFGATCMGADIDMRILRGKGAGKTMRDNFEQYGLPLPELVRADLSPRGATVFSFWDRSARAGVSTSDWRPPTPFIGAIVCDPPYGIRAGARKSGSRYAEVKVIAEEHREGHIPQTQPYSAVEVMRDLLELAARSVVVGGRLVYLIPVDREEYDPRALPTHPCLELVANSEQILGYTLSRRLITMEKTRDYCRADYDRFKAVLSGSTTEEGAAAASSFYSDFGVKHERRQKRQRLEEAEAAAAAAAAAGGGGGGGGGATAASVEE